MWCHNEIRWKICGITTFRINCFTGHAHVHAHAHANAHLHAKESGIGIFHLTFGNASSVRLCIVSTAPTYHAFDATQPLDLKLHPLLVTRHALQLSLGFCVVVLEGGEIILQFFVFDLGLLDLFIPGGSFIRSSSTQTDK